jgi:hypothetical protein
MTNSPKAGENPQGPGRGLRRAAWAAVASGAAGGFLVVLAFMGSFRSEGIYDGLMQGALILGLLGMAISLGVLVIAIAARSRYPGGLLGQLSVLLPLPFVLVQPVCYFQTLGLGLGGDTTASAFYGHLGLASIILAPVTFIVGLVAAIRARGPSELGSNR